MSVLVLLLAALVAYLVGLNSAQSQLTYANLLMIVSLAVVFAPLKRIRPRHRGRAVAVLLLVGLPSALIALGKVETQRNVERDAQLATLKELDSKAYLTELKKIDLDRWFREAQTIDPEAYKAESERRMAEKKRTDVEAKAKAEAERGRLAEKRCKGEDNAMQALVVSQIQYITPRLRSPSTADFPYYYDDGVSVTILNDCTFVVRTYVDAQNAFGATIRSRFLVKLQRDINNPDAWRLIDMFTLD